jgi:hypothetical protein
MKRVTHEDLDGLKVLAAFLNFDWESGDSKQLEQMTKDVHPFYRVVVVEGALEDRGKAHAVQEELKTDLAPIFAPEGKVEPEQADFRISQLIRKLNEVESKIEWDIEPKDFERESWGPTGDPEEERTEYGLRPLSPDEVKSKSLDIYPTGELSLLGYRWYFGRKRFQGGIDRDFGRVTIYQIILDAFRSGAIARFRRCLHCKAFFVAEDDRKQFCSDEHRNDFNNKQRLESGYFEKRRRNNRQRQIAKARRLRREGKSLAQIAKETKLSLRVLKKEGIVR